MNNASDRIAKHNKLVLLRSDNADKIDLQTLLVWMSDPSAEVRDWATFTLGNQRDDDSDAIREALWVRVSDADFDTRSEAILGLARRLDERAMAPLLNALNGDEVGLSLVEAAAYFACKELLPSLEALQTWWDGDLEALKEAIECCRGEPSPEWWRDNLCCNRRNHLSVVGVVQD